MCGCVCASSMRERGRERVCCRFDGKGTRIRRDTMSYKDTRRHIHTHTRTHTHTHTRIPNQHLPTHNHTPPPTTTGCSDLLFELYGKHAGKHTRVAAGYSSLPLGAAVEIEMVVEVKDGN